MKKFEQLLLAGITEEITAKTKEDMLKQVREIFESEMCNNGLKPSVHRVQDWLQGLCSTVYIPFYNNEIIAWYEHELERKLTEKEEDDLLETYWPNAAKTLYTMLYN